MKKIIALLCLTVLIIGCASVPTGITMKSGAVPYYDVNQAITIKNIGVSEDLKKWSVAIISLLSTELEKRGAKITSDSPIVLKVGITKRSQIPAGLLFCNIVTEVRTGDGYKKNFNVGTGSDVSLTFQKSCNSCVIKTVAAILNNEKISDYIKSK